MSAQSLRAVIKFHLLQNVTPTQSKGSCLCSKITFQFSQLAPWAHTNARTAISLAQLYVLVQSSAILLYITGNVPCLVTYFVAPIFAKLKIAPYVMKFGLALQFFWNFKKHTLKKQREIFASGYKKYVPLFWRLLFASRGAMFCYHSVITETTTSLVNKFYRGWNPITRNFRCQLCLHKGS